MPIVATTIFSRGKVHAVAFWVSKTTHEKYYMGNEVNGENLISAKFFKEYLLTKGCKVNDTSTIEKSVILEETEYYISFHAEAKIIDINDAKDIVMKLGFSYNELIDSYSVYLKSL